MNKEELKQEAEKLYEDWFAHKLGAISIIGVICKMAEPREKRIEELEKENAELKAFKEKCKFNVNDIFKEIETENKLTKAKEIIKEFLEFVNNDIEYDLEHPQEHTDLWNKLCEEAEHFLKGTEE